MPDAPTIEAASPPSTQPPPRRRSPWLAISVFVVVLCVVAGIAGWAIGDRSSSGPSQDSVDVGFVTDMTYHHQQALVMALDYVRNGTDPLLLQIAKEIVTYQAQEIGVMNTLLADWDRTAVDSPTAMAWMHTPLPRSQMTGLATKAQMEELASARGAQLDDLFTRLMIEHHAGGIHMADYAADHASEDTTRYWASNMAEGQRGEISEMNQWRRKHGLQPVVPQYIPQQAPSR